MPGDRSLLVVVSMLLLTPVSLPHEPAAVEVEVKSGELQALLEKARAKHDLPAIAAGVVHSNGKGSVAAVGVRKRGTEIRVTTDDQWHLGSNTKPMTALLIALLIEAGLLDWDTPLEQIFPEQSAKWSAGLKKITPAHLLTHTSGLPANWPLGWFFVGGRGTPREQRATMLKSLGMVKLATKPGEKYEYSNLGYVLLGAIIDQRGRGSWEEQLDRRIFRPLGIKHWGLGPADTKDKVTQPWPHRKDGKPAAGGVLDNPPIMNSAGRVRMPVADYNRFLAETLRLARGEKGLLRPATAAKLFSNPYPASPHSLSAWGGFRKEPGAKGLALKHDGSNTFNYCSAIVLPDRNLAIGVFTNQAGPGAKACHDVRGRLQRH
jgi:CubicO group peptidase (beta-lactamase class C family)